MPLTGAGSIANSSNVIDNGIFDISGTTAGTSITTLAGSGGVTLGAQTLTLTAASGAFSGVLADGGFRRTGGGLTIAGGTETLTGTNTYTGATTIDLGATLQLGNGGTTGTVAGGVVDNGLVQFNYSGPVTVANSFLGHRQCRGRRRHGGRDRHELHRRNGDDRPRRDHAVGRRRARLSWSAPATR